MFIAIIYFASCSPKPTDRITNTQSEEDTLTTASIFGHYYYSNNLVGSGIELFRDSTYKYHFGSCLQSGQDSGIFTFHDNIITLTSAVVHLFDTNNNGHDQYIDLTEKKYKFQDNKIYYQIESGDMYDISKYWDKKGTNDEVKFNNGNFGSTLYNSNRQISQKGEFRNYRLINGQKFIYNDRDSLERIEFYKDGQLVNDSLILKK